MTTTELMATPAPTIEVTGATAVEPEKERHVCIICSKGTLDMAYPGLIMANAARMSGIKATLFFTFWGLDIITEKTVDELHVPNSLVLIGDVGICALANSASESLELVGVRGTSTQVLSP